MTGPLERFGSLGAVIAAAACPICFPKLALVGALFGLGALSAYESQLFIAAQALTVIAAIGHGFSYRRHRNRWILASAMASAAAVFTGLYWLGSELVVYAGFAGLVAASLAEPWLRWRREKMPAIRRA